MWHILYSPLISEMIIYFDLQLTVRGDYIIEISGLMQ